MSDAAEVLDRVYVVANADLVDWLVAYAMQGHDLDTWRERMAQAAQVIVLERGMVAGMLADYPRRVSALEAELAQMKRERDRWRRVAESSGEWSPHPWLDLSADEAGEAV